MRASPIAAESLAAYGSWVSFSEWSLDFSDLFSFRGRMRDTFDSTACQCDCSIEAWMRRRAMRTICE